MVKKVLLFAAAAFAGVCAAAQMESVRFEAESVLAPGIPLRTNNFVKPPVWTLYTKDPNKKVWSGERVLQLTTGAEEMAPGTTQREIKFLIPVEKDGNYSLKVKGYRPLAFSFDGGKSWKKISNETMLFWDRAYKAGEKVEVMVSPCYKLPKVTSVYLDYFELGPAMAQTIANTELKGKIVRGAPEGWEKYASKKGKLDFICTPGKVVVNAGELPFWLMSSKTIISGKSDETYSVSAEIKNIGKTTAKIALQFVGYRGEKVVRHSVKTTTCNLAPGESVNAVVSTICPQDIDGLQFRFVGYKNSQFEIKNVKFEIKKNVKSQPVKAAITTPQKADAPEGRFESEEVLAPGVSVKKNTFTSKDWFLWTNDPGRKAWSGGSVMRVHYPEQDMLPGTTGKEIKFHIPVKKSGNYSLYARTVRNLALSVDGGKKWTKAINVAMLFARRTFEAGDVIEVIASPCYTTPGNVGVVYLDYFELRPAVIPQLINPDFSAGLAGKDPVGWALNGYHRDKASVRVENKRAIVTTEAVGFATFTNRVKLLGEAGDMFRVTAKVTNLNPRSIKHTIQFIGLKGNTVVNHAVSAAEPVIASGATQDVVLEGAIPAEADSLQYRFVVYSNQTMAFSDVRLEYLGNVAGKAEKVQFAFVKDGKLNWTAENASLEVTDGGKSLKVKAVPGKRWKITSKELRPAIVGEGLDVCYTAAGKNARLRTLLTGYHVGEQARLSVTRMIWRKLSAAAQKFCDDSYVSTKCDKLKMSFEGEGDVVLSDLSLKRVQNVEWAEPEYRKVPIPGYAARKTDWGRGVYALPMEDGKVYISWRMLPEDDKKTGFDVFSSVGGKEVKLNSSPVVQTSDFVVDKPVADARYIVRPATGFKGKSGSAKADKLPYVDYHLSRKRGIVWGIAPADLDGDGEYDFVVRNCDTNDDPAVFHHRDDAPHNYIEAIHRDGRVLWCYDLGPNLESGIWFTTVGAADLDGDGKAEVFAKTSDPDDGDLREFGFELGKILSGPEYLTVFDGMTGKVIARAPWPDRQPYFTLGAYAHRALARNQMAVFRPDGKTDCILALRGTYTFMQAEAWKLENGKLVSLWKYNNLKLGTKWWGQGSHQTRVADVDGDGRDEVFLGGAVLDDDGSPLWTTGHGHPDYIFVGDVTKRNPGLEAVTLYESKGNIGGVTCADAKTGKVIWELKEPHQHIHTGYACDMDANYRGWEVGASDWRGKVRKEYHYSPDGELLFKDQDAPYRNYKPLLPHFAYWDADLQKEVTELRMRDHLGGDAGGPEIRGGFLAVFDLDGDWREEVFVKPALGKFRIYRTTIPAMDRRVTLMNDEIYRKSVLSNSSGYLLDTSCGLLFTDDSVNFNMTVLAREKDTLQTVVSAPLDRGVVGKVVLTAPNGVKITPAQWDVELKAGEIKSFKSKLENPSASREVIVGKLTLRDGTVLRGQVPAASVKVDLSPRPATGIFVEAEDFKSQRGGEVYRRSDKRGVSGRVISHWDKIGHAIAWDINVPADGKYKLQVRYCNGASVERILRVNGSSLGKVTIPSSEGVFGGNFPYEWKTFDLAEVELKKGVVQIELENIDGYPTNLDYLKLEPVK